MKKIKVVDRFSSTSAVTGGRKATERTKGAGIFFWKEVPNLQNIGVDKTATPLFRQQKFYAPPHHRYTLPPKQAKIVYSIDISLFEQNKHTIYGHFVTPYILWPPYYDPLPKKIPAP